MRLARPARRFWPPLRHGPTSESERSGTIMDKFWQRTAGEAAGPTVDLEALVDAYVALHAGMRQRDADWYASMGTTVGGSELAAVMGMNPYKSFHDVVFSKVASLSGGSDWDGGGEACWWGVLFEDVIAAYVEVDLGAAVKGGEICVQELAGHRNSPDGFVVARTYRDADGQERLWTTDLEAACEAAGEPAPPLARQVLLLEFKCPISRKPAQAVPRHYRPQLWSGLMVAPIARRALFVDAVFRKCGLADLGDTPEYDAAYHSRDRGAWELPVAWGLVGVYAPLLSAPRRARFGWRGPEWAPGDPAPDAPDADASLAAWQLHAAYFGLRPDLQVPALDVADLGDMGARDFGRALGLINRGRFPVARLAPCFADGRGRPLHTGPEIGAALGELRRGTPADHWLFGVLPWKLFEVDYVPAERRPGFADEVVPLIAEVHKIAAEAVASGDPGAFLASRAARPPPPEGKSDLVGEEDIQALFDSIAR